jgi:hypothetical protein
LLQTRRVGGGRFKYEEPVEDAPRKYLGDSGRFGENLLKEPKGLEQIFGNGFGSLGGA